MSYTPGSWTLLARTRTQLLVSASPGEPPISLLWDALGSGAANSVIDVLARELPHAEYCLVSLDNDRVQVAQVGVAAVLDGHPVTASSRPSEVALPGTGGTLVAAGGSRPSSIRLPLEAGIVGAGALFVAIGVDPETVLAAYCSRGHVSDAEAPECRVCGDPMPAQPPRAITRPSLGALVLATGESIDLDRGAVLGRAPRTPQDSSDVRHLINLSAYGRDVSRQHVEVIVEGWDVFVRDLGSANGTRIRDSSGTTTVLEPGVALRLAPDSEIDIAGATRISYRIS